MTGPDTGQRSGALAQLGERLHGMQEVRGSIPLGSTKLPERTRSISFLRGSMGAGFLYGQVMALPLPGRLPESRV